MKLFLKRLFSIIKSKKKARPDSLSLDEIRELQAISNNNIRGLNSTIKHYRAMSDSGIKEVRKKHYAKMVKVAELKLEREKIEQNTLAIVEEKLMSVKVNRTPLKH